MIYFYYFFYSTQNDFQKKHISVRSLVCVSNMLLAVVVGGGSQ